MWHPLYAIGSKGMVTRGVAANGMVATGTATKGAHLACSAGVWDMVTKGQASGTW